VRITEDNLSPHVDELIYKKQAAFKHFLVDEYAANCLGSRHQHYTHEVGREAWPGSIVNGHDRAIEKSLNLVHFLSGDMNIVSSVFQGNTHTFKDTRNDAQLINAGIFDGEGRLGHGCETDKAANFYHVGQQAMPGTTQYAYAFDMQQIGTDPLNLCPHIIEQLAELLYVRFTGSIVDRGGSLSQHGSHEDIGRTRHRDFLHKDILARQMTGRESINTAVGIERKMRPELFKPQQVCIKPPAAYFIPSRAWQRSLAKTRQKRAYQHD